MGGLINIYDDIAKYWELRKVINLKDNAADRFLTGVNPKATRQECFLRNQPLGENKIRYLVQNACAVNGIKGVGSKDQISFHGLRGTVVSLLIESGMPDSSTVLRTGHRQMDSIRPYHNIRGSEGRLQQDIIFNGKKRENSNDGTKFDSKDISKSNIQKRSKTMAPDVADVGLNPPDCDAQKMVDIKIPQSEEDSFSLGSSGSISGVTINGSVTFNVYNK